MANQQKKNVETETQTEQIKLEIDQGLELNQNTTGFTENL